MKFTLRDYQKKASDAGVEFFTNPKQKDPSVIVIPTGGGKSLVIADIANRLNGNTLVFQPSKELLQQNYSKYISYGNKASIYSASVGVKEIGKVTFATIGSVKTKPELFKEFQYCIIDECHLVPPNDGSMYRDFLDKLNIKILGLTATPIRLKQYNYPSKHSKLVMIDRTRPRVFTRYIHVTQIEELNERNYFSNVEYHSMDFDGAKLVVNSTGADYTKESMAVALKENDTLNKVKESLKYLINAGRKHILVFVPTIAEAAYVAKGQGTFVSGKTPKKKRNQIINDFRAGKIPFVANVGVLAVGFDFPALDTIIMVRPTMSLAIYYQSIGRGVRPHPDKKECLVYDFVGNYKKFGKVESLQVRSDDDGMWGVYTHEGRLLTNRDITEIGKMQKSTKRKKTGKMEFGQHRGKKFEEVPIDYMRWVYENVDRKPWTREALDWCKENKDKLTEPEISFPKP
jgi:DNA repair protein RadD